MRARRAAHTSLKWYLLCQVYYRNACSSQLRDAFAEGTPFNVQTEYKWADGFGSLVSSTGSLAAIVVPGTPAAAAALKALTNYLGRYVYGKKTAGTLYRVTSDGGVSVQSGVKVTSRVAESEDILRFLAVTRAFGERNPGVHRAS